MGETNELDYENLLHALASRAQCPDTQAWLSVGRGFGRVDMGERGCSGFSQGSTCSERGCGPPKIAMTRSQCVPPGAFPTILGALPFTYVAPTILGLQEC